MQHPSLQLDNVPGTVLREYLHALFEPFASNHSGPTEPPATFPFMLWADTTAGFLKIRNAVNTAWITIGPLDTASFGLATRGANTFTGPQDFNGHTLQRPVLLEIGRAHV